MRWSSLNATQRASVLAGARFNRDTVIGGRVVRLGGAKNGKAEALHTLRLLDRDADRARKLEGRRLAAEALAAFTPEEQTALATRVPSGRARGAQSLNRARAGAMPMNYFRGSSVGC